MVLSPGQNRAGFSALVEPTATALLLGRSPVDLTDGFSLHTSLDAVSVLGGTLRCRDHLEK